MEGETMLSYSGVLERTSFRHNVKPQRRRSVTTTTEKFTNGLDGQRRSKRAQAPVGSLRTRTNTVCLPLLFQHWY